MIDPNTLPALIACSGGLIVLGISAALSIASTVTASVVADCTSDNPERLAESSLRTLVTDISRREGKSNAIIDRNLELIASRQQAQNQGSALSLSGKLLDVDANRPNWAVVGLELGTGALKAGAKGYKMNDARD